MISYDQIFTCLSHCGSRLFYVDLAETNTTDADILCSRESNTFLFSVTLKDSNFPVNERKTVTIIQITQK